jgi:ADP-heptose:LPS heptosyltransferase
MTRLIQFVFRIILFFDKRLRDPEKRDDIDYKNIKRILLVNTTALGDTLLSTPAIRTAREKFQDAYIVSLVHVKQEEILKNNPRIDELILYPGKYKGLIRLIQTLRKKKFDMVVVLHANDPDIVPLVYLTGARYRAGWAESKFSFLFTHTFKRPEGERIHTINQRLGIVKSVGIESDGVEMEYFFDEEDGSYADKFLRENDISAADTLIGIHPFGSLKSKSWPNYIEFIEKMAKDNRFKVILIGGKKHEEDILKNWPEIDSKIVSAVGKTNIGQTAALIKRCKVFITTDSGPFHLAVALKTPTVLLVGPTIIEVTGPYQDRELHRVIKEDVDCAPCRLKTCDEHTCMKGITPEKVMKELEKALAEG